MLLLSGLVFLSHDHFLLPQTGHREKKVCKQLANALQSINQFTRRVVCFTLLSLTTLPAVFVVLIAPVFLTAAQYKYVATNKTTIRTYTCNQHIIAFGIDILAPLEIIYLERTMPTLQRNAWSIMKMQTLHIEFKRSSKLFKHMYSICQDNIMLIINYLQWWLKSFAH